MDDMEIAILADEIVNEHPEFLERFNECIHAQTCHKFLDEELGWIVRDCPHYHRGFCDLHESHPEIFPKECIIIDIFKKERVD